jgi:Bacterial Ig-like domain (group 3)/FG-GAP-like repeat
MSRLTERLFDSRRPRSSRRGPGGLRKDRRFAAWTEPLEARIAPVVNIYMNAVSVVDANDSPITNIYQNEKVYIQAEFTTVNLPSDASYRIRYIVDGTTIYSPYITLGHAVLIPYTATWTQFDGPFIAQPGPPTGPLANQVLVTVNPEGAENPTFTESTYTDNSLSSTFEGISSPAQLYIPPLEEPQATVTAGAIGGGGIQVQVDIEDQFGNLVANDVTDMVSAALATTPPPPANSVLGGNTTVTALDGIANFDTAGLTLNKAGTVYLVFSVPGLSPVTSTAINVVPASPAQVAVAQQSNATGVAGVNFGTLKASIEDGYGNVETNLSSTPVMASLASGAGMLLGQLGATTFQGVATFAFLSDDAAGPVTIAFNSGSLTQAISNSILINPSFPDQLLMKTEPSPTGTVGQPLATVPVVEEEDQYGNLETTDNATVVTAKPASGVGPLQGATATVSGGVATFSNLADTKAETVSFKFSGAGVPLTVTSTPVVVGKATPTISWSPAPLASTSGLGAPQFDAIAKNGSTVVPGTFVYTPVQGTVLPLGPHQISVTFTPYDTSDYNGTTGTATVDVLPPTTTTLAVSATTVTYKNPITITASVSPQAGGTTPTGSVTFLDGSIILGTSKLDGTGHAKLTVTNLPDGTPSITAKYSGDPTYAASTSAVTALHARVSTGADFDGDGRSDISVYDQTTGTFLIQYSGGGGLIQPLGNPADKNIPVAGDFDGDGKTDLAVFDQTTATFLILYSGGGGLIQALGNPADKNIPVAGDFNGDGKTDLAVFDQTTATFLILYSGGGGRIQSLGNAADVNIPVAGDFDGDGKTDLAVFDQTTATFLILYSGGGGRIQSLGNYHHVNIPVAGDFDGDGKSDLAVYDQNASTFLMLYSGGGGLIEQFGNANDVSVPVQGDFDGDGKADLAVFDESGAVFLILDSGGGGAIQLLGNHKDTLIVI